MNKKIIIRAMQMVLVIVVLYQVVSIYQLKQSELTLAKKQEGIQRELQEMVVTKLPEETKEEQDKKKLLKLQESYPDVVVILEIPGTKIEYPIVQGKDNEYYMNPNLYGKYDVYGEVFLDYRNNPNLSNQNTIIYGHNVTETGDIFNELLQYGQQDFLNLTEK